MKDTSEKNRQGFREGLFQALASEGHTKEKCSELTAFYDRLTEGGMSAEGSFQIVYSAHGASDGRQMLNHVGRWIHDNLEHFQTAFPKISLDSKQRLKKIIETLNANISKCCLTVDGKDVSPESAAAAKVKMLDCLSNPTIYTATASNKSKPSLVLEVI